MHPFNTREFGHRTVAAIRPRLTGGDDLARCATARTLNIGGQDGRDDIAFTFTSDEFNGATRGADGELRPEQSRHSTSLSQAEEENGQSRIYLGIHWSFDKTEGIEQGRRVARYVMRNAFTTLR